MRFFFPAVTTRVFLLCIILLYISLSYRRGTCQLKMRRLKRSQSPNRWLALMLILSTFHTSSCDWYRVTYCKGYIPSDVDVASRRNAPATWLMAATLPAKTTNKQDMTEGKSPFWLLCDWAACVLWMLKNVAGLQWNQLKASLLRCAASALNSDMMMKVLEVMQMNWVLWPGVVLRCRRLAAVGKWIHPIY